MPRVKNHCPDLRESREAARLRYDTSMSEPYPSSFASRGIRWACWGSVVWLAAWITLDAMSYRSPVYLYHRSPLMVADERLRVTTVHGVAVVQWVTQIIPKTAVNPVPMGLFRVVLWLDDTRGVWCDDDRLNASDAAKWNSHGAPANGTKLSIYRPPLNTAGFSHSYISTQPFPYPYHIRQDVFAFSIWMIAFLPAGVVIVSLIVVRVSRRVVVARGFPVLPLAAAVMCDPARPDK